MPTLCWVRPAVGGAVQTPGGRAAAGEGAAPGRWGQRSHQGWGHSLGPYMPP